MEHQLHELISKEEDLIHYPDKVYSLLARNNLLPDNDENQYQAEPKFIAIFDYLLDNAQIYAILKAIWKLNIENTSLISDHSLKTVLDWSWSKVTKIKLELNNLRKTLGTHALTANWSQPPPLDTDQLDSFLSRVSSLLEGLIQIYKQFIKLETTSREGQTQLNKRLCIIESIKFYVEHLTLFHKFEMLLAPPRPHNTTSPQKAVDTVVTHRNYLSEMHINFTIIEKRWRTRRQQQDELLNAITNTTSASAGDNNSDIIYPFTFLIDCLFEECRGYSNVARLFHHSDDGDDSAYVAVGGYPPKSLIELLDICLECNIGTKMKQIIILYVLCDLMHTEFSSAGQKHILKLINAYCSNTFTIMSTQLDSVLSVPWSTSSTSIVSVGSDGVDPNNSSCLFDLVNGFYLIDSRIADKAFKYLRATDLNYLEFYEKYFILYNTMSVKDHKTAAQYLWLFQKLNANSIVSVTNELTSGTSVIENELGLFRFMSKTSAAENSVNEFNKLKHEQKMHARLILTIYLANQLVNEAYNLVKPHIKNVKSVLKTPSLANHPGVKFSKELLIHFFLQVDRYNQWKHVSELTSQDKDLLLMMFNFLESSNKLSLICMAIDLHVNSQNYKKAIELYDKYSKQIATSKHAYLSTMVEIAREVHNEYGADDEGEYLTLKYTLITSQDIKDTMNFENKFTVPLKELCKNSKRCINLLNRIDDEAYISLLKMPSSDTTIGHSSSAESSSSNHQRQVKFCSSTTKLAASESTNSLMSSRTPYKLTLTPAEATRTPVRKSILATDHHAMTEKEDDYGDSPKRRKPSTPHPTRGVFKFASEDDNDELEGIKDKNEDIDEEEEEEDNDKVDEIEEEASSVTSAPEPQPKETTPPPSRRSPRQKPPMSENNRVLTSSLRVTRVMDRAMSAAKSVKFSAVKHTRNFCDAAHVNVDLQEKMDIDEEAASVEDKPKRDVHKKLVFADDDNNGEKGGRHSKRASLKLVRQEEITSPEDDRDDDYKPSKKVVTPATIVQHATTVMTRRSQVCSSEEIRKSLNEIAENNPRSQRKSLTASNEATRRSTSEPPKQQQTETAPEADVSPPPPTSPPRETSMASQSLAAKAVSPIMSFMASMSERIVASLSPRGGGGANTERVSSTEIVATVETTVVGHSSKTSPSSSSSPEEAEQQKSPPPPPPPSTKSPELKNSPAATGRKSFFSMFGFNLTPRSNDKKKVEEEVEKKPTYDNDIEIVSEKSDEDEAKSLSSSSSPASVETSPPPPLSRSSIKITPKKKPHAEQEHRVEETPKTNEEAPHPLMKCSTSVELAPHASVELTTARMSPIRPSTSRAEAMKLSENVTETTVEPTSTEQDIEEMEQSEEKKDENEDQEDLVSLDDDDEDEEEKDIEILPSTTTTSSTITTTIEIKYLTESELAERKEEEAHNEDYQYDLLNDLNGRKNTIRFTQVDEIATHSHRVGPVEPVEPVAPVAAAEPAVDLNETLERENEIENQDQEKEAEPPESVNPTSQEEMTTTTTTNKDESSFNMSSVSHDGADLHASREEENKPQETTSQRSPSIINQQSSPTVAASAAPPSSNEEFAIPRMSRTNSESSLFSQISSVSEHYEKMKRQEAEQKKSTTAAEHEDEEDDEKRNKKGSKLKRGRQVSTRGAKPATIATRASAAARHHMDDDELKKTSEEVLSSKKTSGKGSLVRRRSDLSSASSTSTATSAVSSRNYQAVAKLAENIPESFGKSDHEVRLTRSKLKNLLVQEDEEEKVIGEEEEKNPTVGVRLTRRNSRRQQQQPQQQPHLEQVNENEELTTTTTTTTTTTSKMSAYNLKKHNAAMEKLNEDEPEHDDAAGKRAKKPPIPISSSRVTRSAKTRSPSPSASSVISVSSVASSVARSATSTGSQTRRRGRPPRAPPAAAAATPTTAANKEENEQDRTLKADDDDDDDTQNNSPDLCLELSPTDSQVSSAMSEATGRQRLTRRRAAATAAVNTTQPTKRSATPPNSSSSIQRAALVTRSYSLRSKAPVKSGKDDDTSSVASEQFASDEVTTKSQQVAKKSTRGRTRKSLNIENIETVDETASSVSELTNEADEIETVVKRTRSTRAKKSPVKEDEEHEVKPKLTRTESEEEKFKFSNPRNVTYGASRSSKKGSAGAKFEFSPPSPIKK